MPRPTADAESNWLRSGSDGEEIKRQSGIGSIDISALSLESYDFATSDECSIEFAFVPSVLEPWAEHGGGDWDRRGNAHAILGTSTHFSSLNADQLNSYEWHNSMSKFMALGCATLPDNRWVRRWTCIS